MAYTEFYCNASTGSNLNGGSDSGSVTYTSTNGNWSTVTNIFTPTDGTNPVSAGVVVGQFASIYIDGATVGVFIARVTAVVNAANGTITVSSSAIAGTAPTTSATARSIKVGGAFLGPNAASSYPFSLSNWANTNTDVAGDKVRTNMTGTFSITSAIGSFSFAHVIQGYTTTAGDGGRATIDGTTSTAALVSDVGSAGMTFTDIIWATSFASANGTIFITTRTANFFRCVFHGARGYALNLTSGSNVVECEFYDNNKSNTSAQASVLAGGNECFLRCTFHDNAGSNTSGINVGGGPISLQNCIFDTNGQFGVSITAGSNNGISLICGCEFYSNGSDGLKIASSTANPVWIENCNFIKNTGAGINNASSANLTTGFAFNNGYGAGTQANGSVDTVGNIAVSGSVTYGSNLTPWADPANGDFRITLAASRGTGRQSFTETAAGYTGTIGHPDIGAAQSLCSNLGMSGLFAILPMLMMAMNA